MPESWRVVTNTASEGRTIMDLLNRESVRIERFAETQPISTYVFAFAAGPFEVFRDKNSSYATGLFVRKSKAERARKESGRSLPPQPRGHRFFRGLLRLQIPLPQGTTSSSSPSFAYNGWSTRGATFFARGRPPLPLRPDRRVPPRPRRRDDARGRSPWFGDLVHDALGSTTSGSRKASRPSWATRPSKKFCPSSTRGRSFTCATSRSPTSPT